MAEKARCSVRGTTSTGGGTMSKVTGCHIDRARSKMLETIGKWPEDFS